MLRSLPLWTCVLLTAFGWMGCQPGATPDSPAEVTPDFTMDFLVGSWQNISDNSAHYEQWEKVNDAFYRGKGFVMSAEDTIFIEELSILFVNGRWLYSARVSDQNDNQSIAFQEVSLDKRGIAFENKDHDFPQRIAYEVKDANSMTASISGVNDGDKRETVFPFDRIAE